MLFFKKRKPEEDKNWNDFFKIIELMKVQIVELTKRVDMIDEKLKSPIIKKKIQEQEKPEEKAAEITDGLDALRQARI